MLSSVEQLTSIIFTERNPSLTSYLPSVSWSGNSPSLNTWMMLKARAQTMMVKTTDDGSLPDDRHNGFVFGAGFKFSTVVGGDNGPNHNLKYLSTC